MKMFRTQIKSKKLLAISRNLLNLTLIFLFIAITGCGGGGGGSKDDSPAPDDWIQERGEFTYEVKPSEKFEQDIQDAVRLFSEITNRLNQLVNLPEKNVNIVAKDCGFINAYYDPSRSEISMCYELSSDIHYELGEYFPDIFGSVWLFVLMHEVSHSIVDQASLSILGKEEDVIDAIATVLMMDDFIVEDPIDRAKGVILAGWYIYYLSQGTQYYSEHSMSDVRLANIICWAGGAEPRAVQGGFTGDLFYSMTSSGRDCQREYLQQSESVYSLLGDYIK